MSRSGDSPQSASVVAQIALLWRLFTLRHWRRSPRSTALLVVLVALGVGMVLSIRLANRAAVAGFTIFTESVTGQSDFMLQPRAGRLPTELLPRLREGLDGAAVFIFPVLEVTASEPDAADAGARAESFTLLGVDLIAVQNLAYTHAFADRGAWIRESAADDGSNRELLSYLADDFPIYISPALAEARGLAPGDTLPLILNDQVEACRVAGVLPSGGTDVTAPADLIVMDLPVLQELAGLRGKIDRVEIRLEDGGDMAARRASLRAALTTLADGQYTVETPDSRRATGEAMTTAFRMNLTVLSLLALIVGVYLIMQALEGAVVKRRGEIAVLRSLGVQPGMIQIAWLVEAATLGLVGSVAGVGLGVVAAQFTVKAVARTVNDLYYTTTVDAAAWVWSEVIIAVALGVVASVVAGWLPARDAAHTPPARLLTGSARSAGPAMLRRPIWGLAFVAIGCGLAMLPPLHLAGQSRFPLAGHLAGFAWILGGTSLAGAMFRPLGAVLVAMGDRWAALRYAGSQFRRVTSRHLLTIGGLLLAIGMATGMGILIHSFETTIQVWVNSVMKADLYVFNRHTTGPSGRDTMPADTVRALAADQDVAGMDQFTVYTIDYRGGAVALAGARLADVPDRREMIWVDAPDDPDFAEKPMPADVMLASESFVVRYELARGDVVDVPTPDGTKSLRIAGVYADYGSERGTLLVDLGRLHAWFGDDAVTGLSVYLRPGVDPEATADRLAREFPGLGVRSNRFLRQEIFRVFRQTFSITYALQGMAVVVAVIGLGLALASLLLERRRETHTLRELGMRRGQIATCTAIEGAGITVVGLIGGVILSLALGWLLIHVINKQSFGWTLAYSPPWGSIAALSAAILVVGVVVSWCVGYWGATLPVDREE